MLSAKKLLFATAEEVKEVMHCEVGSSYHFGNITGIEHIIDSSFTSNKFISFNPGIHTKSIRVRWVDYARALTPRLESLVRED